MSDGTDRLSPAPVSRRDFLGLGGMLSLAVAGGAALLGSLRLLKPYAPPEQSAKFRIGPPAAFPAGSQQQLTDRRVFVVSGPEGLAAISMICTHLGCVVSRTDAGFDCPCHGSRFASDGGLLRGPAPAALPWLEISQAADGTLMVDATRRVTVGTFFKV